MPSLHVQARHFLARGVAWQDQHGSVFSEKYSADATSCLPKQLRVLHNKTLVRSKYTNKITLSSVKTFTAVPPLRRMGRVVYISTNALATKDRKICQMIHPSTRSFWMGKKTMPWHGWVTVKVWQSCEQVSPSTQEISYRTLADFYEFVSTDPKMELCSIKGCGPACPEMTESLDGTKWWNKFMYILSWKANWVWISR